MRGPLRSSERTVLKTARSEAEVTQRGTKRSTQEPSQSRVQFEREKFIELFRFSLNAHEIALTRSEALDRKASGFVAVLTFLIGGVAVMGKWLLDSLLPPTDWLARTLLGVCVALFLSLVVAWFLVFAAFRLMKLKLLPADSDMMDFCTRRSALTVYVKLSERMGEIVEYNNAVMDTKASLLTKGHIFISLSCVLFVVLVLLYVIHALVGDC